MITILGISDRSTIQAGIEEAEKLGKQAVIDMIHVDNLPEKIRQADELGAQVIGVHVGIDSQAHGESPLEALRIARENVTHAQVSVAGGLKDDSYLDSILKYKPDILVVGNGIRKADNPVTAAKRIRERIKAAEQQIMM